MNSSSFGTLSAVHLVTCCFLLYFSQGGRVSYENYKILRVDITSRADRIAAEELYLLGIPEFKIEVSNEFATILVSTSSLFIARIELNRRRLSYQMENITDVQEYIDEIAEPHDGEFNTSYLPYTKIMEFLQDLSNNYSTVTVGEIGKTINNCTIPLVKMAFETTNVLYFLSQEQIMISLNDPIEREIIFVELGTHAREWIAVAAGLVFIEKLAREEDPMLLEKFDFYILPLHNVDGYIYSFDIDRLWRKNRRPLTKEYECGNRFRRDNEIIYGVDLNRNWRRGHGNNRDDPFGIPWSPYGDILYFQDLGFQFPFALPPAILCRIQTNPGPYPFSELETLAVKEKLEELQVSGKTVLAYFAVHNGAQVLLLPYGYRLDRDPTTLDRLTRVANQMAAAMQEVANEVHGVGQIRDIFELIGGSSVDYLYEDLDIEYPIAIELRPSIQAVSTNALSFIRPKEEIVPAGKELFAGIQEFVKIHPDG